MMEKYCRSCGRVFEDSDFEICPYCGTRLNSRVTRQHIPRKLRHQVFQRDGYRCRECGATNKETTLHIDHIKPVSKGGTNDIDNLQTLCETCNLAKYTDEWVGGKTNIELINKEMDNIGIELENITNQIALAKTNEERTALFNELDTIEEKIDILEDRIKSYETQEYERIIKELSKLVDNLD